MKTTTYAPIDHSSHIPIYQQIENLLIEKIKTRILRPYQKVWSEREMSVHFSVSRMTVRRALSNLIHQGYLFTREGKGTFVSDHKIDQPMLKLKNFYDEMVALGMEPGFEVLEYDDLIADYQTAKDLKISPGTKITKIKRLMLGNKIPYSTETKWIVSRHCKLLKQKGKQKDELIDLLSGRCNQCVTKYNIYIEATILNESEAKLFGLTKGNPAFCIKKYAYNSNQKRISYIKSIYRGDLYRLHSAAEY